MKHPGGPVHFQVRWHLNSNGNGTQNREQKTKRKLKNITTSSEEERSSKEREGKTNGMEGKARLLMVRRWMADDERQDRAMKCAKQRKSEEEKKT